MTSEIFLARQKPCGGSGVLRRLKLPAAISSPAVLKGPQSSSAESLQSRFREWQKERPGFSTAKYANHANSIPNANLELARFTWIEHDWLGFCDGGRARSPQRAAGVVPGLTGTASFAGQAAN
jgi:hypothetical protein